NLALLVKDLSPDRSIVKVSNPLDSSLIIIVKHRHLLIIVLLKSRIFLILLSASCNGIFNVLLHLFSPPPDHIITIIGL
ncbi:hypothetical protein L9F63_011945, partial [Diploptera punctata]